MGTTEAMEFLLEKMKDTKTNNDFFQSMGKSKIFNKNFFIEVVD